MYLVLSTHYAGAQKKITVTDTLLLTQTIFYTNTNFYFKKGAVIRIEKSADVSFTHCQLLSADTTMWRGIQITKGASLQLLNSTITNAEFAVQAIGSTGNLIIEQNKFERNRCAIQLYMPLPNSNKVTISNNQIKVNPKGSAGTGIEIYSFPFLGAGGYLQINIFKNNITVENGFEAIGINNHSGSKGSFTVSTNKIWLNATTQNINGIALNNSNGWVLGSNIVSGTTAGNTNLSRYRGFLLKNASNNLLQCNRAYNLTTGYRFEGTCNSSDNFISNDLGAEPGTTIYINPTTTATVPSVGYPNYIGLHATNMNTQMGTQTDRGNKWFGTYNGSGNYSAWNEVPIGNPIFGNSLFIVPNTILYPNTPETPTNNSIQPSSSSLWVSAISPNLGPNCSSSSGTVTTHPNSLLASEQSVINGNYEPPFYLEVSNWQAALSAYRKLKSNPELRESGSAEEAYYDSISQTNIALFADIEEQKEKLFDDTLTAYEQDQIVLRDSLLVYLTQIDSIDTIGTAQFDSIRILINEQLIQAQLNTDTAFIRLNNLIQQRANTLFTANHNIKPEANYEANKRQTNRWCLQLLTDTAFVMDSATLQALQAIAEECFLSGGDAVFDARALYNLVQERSYDDFDNCTNTSNKRDDNEGSSLPDDTALLLLPTATVPYYYLFPNPAKNTVTFAIGNGWYSNEEIEITDVAGRKIALLNANAGGRLLQFSTGFLPSGIYNCNIRKQGNVVAKLKLAVAK